MPPQINPIVPNNESSSNLLTKVFYFIEFVVLIIVCFGIYTFLLFSLTNDWEALGMLVLLFYIASIACFNSVAAFFVYRDMKKLQLNGLNATQSPSSWATITFCFPLVGLAAYLATRRADYKK